MCTVPLNSSKFTYIVFDFLFSEHSKLIKSDANSRVYITSYYWSAVTMSLYCTAYEISVTACDLELSFKSVTTVNVTARL